MASLHEKSSCCGGNIIRFGNRRRQCTACRKTWRVWKRKRGRNKKRVKKKLLEQFLGGQIVSLQKESERRHVHESTLRRRLTAALEHYETVPWSININNTKDLVLLADAIVKRIKHKWWTVYFMAIKAPKESQAILLPPLVLAERESYAGWRTTINSIPLNIHSAISALVCDGHQGLVYYAKWSGWHVQRCHAHLLFSIAGRRSQSPWSRHRQEGKEIYNLAKAILTGQNDSILTHAINEIEVMGWTTKSRQLQKIISGFLKSLEDYRTYLVLPELNIPATNNAMESFISQFQEVCHRARGFATVRSLRRWVCAFTKHKRSITCNGSHQPN